LGQKELKNLIKMKILTNDPSFTAWGWAVLNEKSEVLDYGCIKTSPDYKRCRIRKGDDKVRRTSQIINTLLDVIKKWNVDYMLAELPHGSQNASAAVMIGIVTGVVQTLSDVLNIGVEWYSEADAKKFIFGRKDVSKEEIQKFVTSFYKINLSGTKYIDEAVSDALAIHYVALKESPVLKLKLLFKLL